MNHDDRTVPVRIASRPGARAATRQAQQQARARQRRRGAIVAVLALVLLGAVVGGGYLVLRSFTAAPDFEGDGTGEAFVRVTAEDTTRQIGGELTESGVVASVDAFVDAAADEPRIRSVQPGYYQLRREMSASSAVALLLDPAVRVGQLEIRGGTQLDDTSAPDGTVAPGVLSLIAAASCTAGDEPRCLDVEQLRTTMAETDPAQLGVPEWALEAVAAAEPNRRLEGLLVPGRYDVAPDTPPADVLRALLTTSTNRLVANTGLLTGSQALGASPYEVLTIASLVEKEAITPDMPKVARVVWNRLGAGQRLELDSMVNYPLDLQALRTTVADRARPGPYNSYVVTGLPPTPISAPGEQAVAAALEPAAGSWLFFVRCQTDGTSCFSEDFAEHQEAVALARRNGAF